MLHALIMAGGGGTRFWPRSRVKRPKQFLCLTGERTLLQQALERIEVLVPPERSWVMTSAMHRQEAVNQLPWLPGERILGEPCGRDTAACIGLGAALIERTDSQAVMMVMPADHLIEPAQEFCRAAGVAHQMIEERPAAIVTFGITPTYPAVGYGYIHRGGVAAQRQGITVYHVAAFKEKPDGELAERFVASDEYLWNSGIFVWRAATILAALRECQPKLASAVQRIADAWDTPDRERVWQSEYNALGKISIDYAVMEKAKNALVIQAPYQWDDVGSWLALERLHPHDEADNTVLATHCGIGTHGCVIVGDPGKLITTIGVNNLIIIQDGDATLVADRREEAAVKALVEQMKLKGLESYL